MNKYFLYIPSIAVSSLLALSACSDEAGVTDNNEGKTAIDLTVGMAGAPVTRAITTMRVNQESLSTLPVGTTLYMVMKSEVTAQEPKWTITKAQTGTVTDKKSAVSFSDAGTIRYWDDCGARDASVSIYGVCTPNGTPNVPTIGGNNTYTYTATPSTGAWSTTANTLTISNWTVQSNQAALNATTFADQDLCYTNNVSYNSTGDHRLKFNKETKKFDKGDLVFYHALTKVTVKMTAGDGFDAADSKKAFVSPATATIHGFKTQCDFTLADGVATPEGDDIADITTLMTADDKSGTEEVVSRSAIIMPGRTLSASDKIVTVSADGSTYDVTAEQLVNAMPAGEKTMQQGTEYVINVRVSKTGINVAAYVKAWDTVNAAEVEPKIDVTTAWGTTDGTAKEDEFSFYLSSTSSATGYGTASGDAFAANSHVAKVGAAWTMTPQLYWNDHSTGYYFRGVWPNTATNAEPKVIASGDNQVIAVSNVAYKENTYPSDLMIGIPSNEPASGITATKGLVNLTFQYIMSQVEVNLSTTDDASQVSLTDATVEIVNGYTSGEVLLMDRSVVTKGEVGSYSLDATSTDNQYRNAVVPQTLTFTTANATTNLRFKITIKNSSNPEDIDVYYADVNPILETGKVTKVAPDGKWESGKHYVYNLKVSKTKVDASATLTDWITVTADENIWF